MRSPITACRQTVVLASIRARFGRSPQRRLEWFVDGDGAIRSVPVALDPVQAVRGAGRGGSVEHLFADREADRNHGA